MLIQYLLSLRINTHNIRKNTPFIVLINEGQLRRFFSNGRLCRWFHWFLDMWWLFWLRFLRCWFFCYGFPFGILFLAGCRFFRCLLRCCFFFFCRVFRLFFGGGSGFVNRLPFRKLLWLGLR